MARGAESYLQMWERAVGIAGPRCRMGRAHFKRRGLGRVRIGYRPQRLLRRAGQPARRNRVWRYCVRERKPRVGKVAAVFTRRGRVGLVASTARAHEALGITPGSRSGRVRRIARPYGRGVWVRRVGRGGRRMVYGVRRGRVRFVAVASRSVAAKRSTLRRYVRLAGVR